MGDILAAEAYFFHKLALHPTKGLTCNINAIALRTYLDHTYIINLAHRGDRRKHIRGQLRLLGFHPGQYSFLKATDRSWTNQRKGLLEVGVTKGLPSPSLKSLDQITDPSLTSTFLSDKSVVWKRIHDAKKKNQGLAEVAVALSHARIWAKVAEMHKDSRVMILEDDACISSTFPTCEFRTLMLKAAANFPQRELVILGYCYPEQTKVLLESRFNVLEVGRYYCMQAYIVTPAIAKLMLKMAFPLRYPIDGLFQETILMDKAFVFKNPLFNQSAEEGVTSDIQTAEGIAYELEHSAHKFGRCFVP
jgi:GR25 family glycosyltransferase involved in LPS biosynthesis